MILTYDILTTNVYIDREKHFALNLGKTKDWYKVSYAHFEAWAKKVSINWRAIKPHLNDVMDKAKSLWPKAIDQLPMDTVHKMKLQEHWLSLHKDFSGI